MSLDFPFVLLPGTSSGDCPAAELKSLLKALRVDPNQVASSSGSDDQDVQSETRIFPDVDLPAIAARKSSVPRKVAQGDFLKLRQKAHLWQQSNHANGEVAPPTGDAEASPDEEYPEEESEAAADPPGAGEDGSKAADADAEGAPSAAEATNDEDEMLEVTPEVQMFFGNHFLASSSMENGDGPGAEEGGDHADKEEMEMEATSEEESASNGGGGGGASFLEQTMARHKEMMMRNGGMDMSADDAAGGALRNMAAAYGGLLSRISGGVGGGAGGGGGGGGGGGDYTCRLCGKTSGNGASLFAHLLYPHYAHLWRTDVPHRAARYDCGQCNYTTVKRQHYVMHVARVHDELRKKLAALGENLAVLDNLTQRSQNNSKERIVSKIAKMVGDSDGGGGPAPHPHPLMPSAHRENQEMAVGGSPSLTQSPSNRETSFEEFGASSSNPGPSGNGGNFSSPTFGGAHAGAGAGGGGFDFAAHLPGSRYPRGAKPFVKCRMCGKCWKGKDNFFTHLVSTHFKYLWAAEVPRQADMYFCHVPGCTYQSKYRYNFLFHLAGKHKQLKQKLAEENIPTDVLTPIEMDSAEMEEHQAEQMVSAMNAAELMKQSKMLKQQQMQQQQHHYQQQQQQQHHQRMQMMTTPPSAVKGSHSPQTPASSGPNGAPPKSSQNNTRLICRVCQKVSLNHTCHRQHVVGKHFQEFWAHLTPDGMGIFNCHHIDCSYKTTNRSVFVIHLAYVHQELKTKLINSGRDPTIA